MWAVIGGILVVVIGLRLLDPRRSPPKADTEVEGQKPGRGSTYRRAWGAVTATCRRYLLPESSFVSVFGHVTKLQVLLLAGILGYLLIFS